MRIVRLAKGGECECIMLNVKVRVSPLCKIWMFNDFSPPSILVEFSRKYPSYLSWMNDHIHIFREPGTIITYLYVAYFHQTVSWGGWRKGKPSRPEFQLLHGKFSILNFGTNSVEMAPKS